MQRLSPFWETIARFARKMGGDARLARPRTSRRDVPALRIALIGFGLSLANWTSLLVLLTPTFAVHWWRMRIEENALMEAFGDTCRHYMARTKRLIPFIY